MILYTHTKKGGVIMFVIQKGKMVETDDYEKIQSSFEDYLYGGHRGLDIDEKELEEFYLYDYIYEEGICEKELLYRKHTVIK